MRRVNAHAHDAGVPKSVELEFRVSRIEGDMKDLREMLEVLTKRVVALQAQMDHLLARLDRR